MKINIVIVMLTMKSNLLHLKLKQQFDHLEVLVIDPHQQRGPALRQGRKQRYLGTPFQEQFLMN